MSTRMRVMMIPHRQHQQKTRKKASRTTTTRKPHRQTRACNVPELRSTLLPMTSRHHRPRNHGQNRTTYWSPGQRGARRNPNTSCPRPSPQKTKRPNAPPRRQRQSFNQAIHLRDKHSAEPRFASNLRGPASRTAHQKASHKLGESSPATPMGATLSRFGRSFSSVASSVRPFNPRSSIRRHERARRAAAPSGVTKTVQKKPPQEFKRARDNVYRRKNDPLMAEIELLVILKSKAQYQTSGLRTKQQVDQELEERNKLIQKLMKEKADKDRFAVAPLDQASMQRTKEIITKASQQQGHSFCTKFRITIAGHDLVKLCPNQWLNDNIIDFYINLITEREKAKGRKVEGMTTHFFTTFERNGYQKVARWLSRKTKEYCRKNIMELDTLLIPINIGGAHWTLGVIAPKQKRVEFWNSLKSSNHSDDVRRYCTLLRKYLMEEAGITELEGWTDYSPEIQPQQNNYADCGVFTVKTAEFRARGAEPAYTPRDAQNLRYRMVLEIVDGELHPVGDDD
ncbi:cysteine proteinase [Ascodesmis nigricans]|uniref:Cysteine proteinase n=1 Tax=Ascodesmis nigricans TaxID=341454 RepID=A0A4S2MS53_9PEZI|nr:cysteine proteinase [Ascodesmis nigricans]